MYRTASSMPNDVEARPRGDRIQRVAEASYLPTYARAQINIGLWSEQRATVVAILNRILADEFVLYTKSRRFHWNVEAPNFSELHELFEKQYEQLEEIVDQVAERTRMLGGIAAGSLKEYIGLTRLHEESGRSYDARDMIEALLRDHETLIRTARRRTDLFERAWRRGHRGLSDRSHAGA